MNETTTEVLTEALTEELTEVPTEPMQEVLTEIVTEIVEVEVEVEVEVVPTLEPNPENPIHDLFSILGCNLDHVPASPYEAFTMSLQFLGALFFLIWFCRFLWSLMKPFIRGGL